MPMRAPRNKHCLQASLGRVCCAAFLFAATSACFAEGPPAIDFERDVAPVLMKRCLLCHNQTTASGELDLTTREGLLRGGESGPAAIAGDADESYLLQRIVGGEMPPPERGQSKALPNVEAELLKQWIEQGAPWPEGRQLDCFERTTDVRAGRDWWSLQPLRRPDAKLAMLVEKLASQPGEMPAHQPGEQLSGQFSQTPIDDFPINNPIDAFWLARLSDAGLRPAPPATRATLLRRITMNVVGLAPTDEQAADFLLSTRPDAWERLVDQLLASPQYGVKWSRHWLDVARYAETCGYERDQELPFAWRYRDWVVAAFNGDMPYDRFVVEQLAGDQSPERTESSVIATGFLRLGAWNDEPNDPEDYVYERLEDLVHATSSAFLGLSVKCARCHDHKFDPIAQDDYYRLAACFWNGPVRPRERDLLGGPSADELGFSEALGWTDVGQPVDPLQVLKYGERHSPLRAAWPGSLSALTYPASADFARHLPPDGATSGNIHPDEDQGPPSQRRALAQWIASGENPLTARVIVNRLWQHHFGQGLVRTPNNFGFRGELPTHPELLDWLASELISHRWSLKHVQRLILTSSVYQTSSESPRAEEYQQIESANRTLWRFPRRRLDAESLRDALLNVGSRLDLQVGGPSFRPSIAAEALEGLSRKEEAWTASPRNQQNRRSLYMFTKRGLLPPFMTAFDFGDTTLPCEQRDITTVAPQALAMLNNELVHDCSQEFAGRVMKLAGPSISSRIDVAWRLALGRPPSDEENAMAQAHVADQQERFSQASSLDSIDSSPPPDAEAMAWASLCQVLLSCNEFLYVD